MTGKIKSNPRPSSVQEFQFDSETIEELFVHGVMELSDNQIEQMVSSGMVTFHEDVTDRFDDARRRLGSGEWISPVSAVHLLSPFFGGDIKAKAVIAERIRDGAVRCCCLWWTEGPDYGPVPLFRPEISNNARSVNSAFKVSPVSRRPGVTHLGPGFWHQSDDWERDTKRWSWAGGQFVVCRDVILADGTAGTDAKERIGISAIRSVASHVRLRRADIQEILDAYSTSVSKQKEPIAPPSPVTRGRPGPKRSPSWNDWFAEVVAYAQSTLIDWSINNKDFYEAIQKRLYDNDAESLDLDTVDKAIGAIKRRMKKAKNEHEPDIRDHGESD